MRYLLIVLLLSGCVQKMPETKDEWAAALYDAHRDRVSDLCVTSSVDEGVYSDQTPWACDCFVRWTAYAHPWWYGSGKSGTIEQDLREMGDDGVLPFEPEGCERFGAYLPEFGE